MPLKPIDPDRIVEWIPPSQQNDPEPTVFLFRPLTMREHRHIDNITQSFDADDNRTLRVGDASWWRVRFGLAGLRNFPGVEWKTEKVPHSDRLCVVESVLARIPRLEFLQASNQIANLAEPSEGE